MTLRGICATALLWFLCGSAAGCYSYRAVTGLHNLSPGSEVRVSLTPAGRLDLEEQTGQLRSVTDGQVLRSKTDSLILLATRATAVRPGPAPRFDTLYFPSAGIEEVTEKELDRRRSAALAVGGLAVVTAFFLWGLEVVGGGSTGSDGPDSPDRSRVPLLDGSGG